MPAHKRSIQWTDTAYEICRWIREELWGKNSMEKGKSVMGSGRRWAVDFTDNSTSPSSRDIPDPLGFARSSQDQVHFFFLVVCAVGSYLTSLFSLSVI